MSQFTIPSPSPTVDVKLELTPQTEASGKERKRPRTEIDTEALVNHPSLYFDDGNVILKCGKTLFRVHRSLLSKHSPVFAELLDTNRNKKTLRGCMLLKVEDDQDDIEAILRIIYDGL
jgi:BTB/POZ domain